MNFYVYVLVCGHKQTRISKPTEDNLRRGFLCHEHNYLNFTPVKAYRRENTEMAEAIRNDVVVALSDREVAALIELLDAQEDLNPALTDLNNTIQAL